MRASAAEAARGHVAAPMPSASGGTPIVPSAALADPLNRVGSGGHRITVPTQNAWSNADTASTVAARVALNAAARPNGNLAAQKTLSSSAIMSAATPRFDDDDDDEEDDKDDEDEDYKSVTPASVLTATPGTRVSGELRLGTGEIYVGALTDNVPNGDGYLRYGDGASYRGHFERGVFSGRGTFESPTSYYAGAFRDGERCGEGVARDMRLALLGGPAAAASLGAFFVTPRLVLVVEIRAGTHARNILSGTGRRTTHVLVCTHTGTLGPYAALVARTTAMPAIATIIGSAADASDDFFPRMAPRRRERPLEDLLSAEPAPPTLPRRATPSPEGDLEKLLSNGVEVMRVVESGTWGAGADGSGRDIWNDAILGRCVPVLTGSACEQRSVVRMLDASGRVTRTCARLYTNGDFCMNRFEGHGRLDVHEFDSTELEFAHDTYEGEFLKGFEHGSGLLTRRDWSERAPHTVAASQRTVDDLLTLSVERLYTSAEAANEGGVAPERRQDGSVTVSVFAGQFVGGVRCGTGVSTRRDGTRVTCNYVNGKKDGEARFEMPNGDHVSYMYDAGERQLSFCKAAPTNKRPYLWYALPKTLRNVLKIPIDALPVRRRVVGGSVASPLGAASADGAGAAPADAAAAAPSTTLLASAARGIGSAMSSAAAGASAVAGSLSSCAPRRRGIEQPQSQTQPQPPQNGEAVAQIPL